MCWPVTLEWDANPEPNVAGYIVYFGTSSRSYFFSTNIVGRTSCYFTNSIFTPGTTYYFAVTAYDQLGLESEFSQEVSFTLPRPTNTPPRKVTGLRIVPLLP